MDSRKYEIVKSFSKAISDVSLYSWLPCKTGGGSPPLDVEIVKSLFVRILIDCPIYKNNHPDFIALISEYKGKPIAVISNSSSSADEITVVSETQMKKMYSDVYEVACIINTLPLKFILDTGASCVSISSVEAAFILKNGYLKDGDILGQEYFSTATGEIHEGTVIRLREIRMENAVLRNIDASVVHNQQVPLLLGQNVLERFGIITIDNINSKLIIKNK